MATVAVMGIPIITRKDTDFSQVYKPRATDIPRSDITQLLLAESVNVVDFGELVKSPDSILIHDSDYDLMSAAFREIVEDGMSRKDLKADVLLVIGGNHSAALPLYHVSGHTIRVDAHRDSHKLYGRPSEINCGTYMYYVQAIKPETDIWNLGLDLLLDNPHYVSGIVGRGLTLVQATEMSNPPEISVIDIDVDALSKDYGLPHGWQATSNYSSLDLSALIAKFKPRVVGIFECVDGTGGIPENIVSGYKNVFRPICKAVAEVAVVRSSSTPQNPQAYAAASR